MVALCQLTVAIVLYSGFLYDLASFFYDYRVNKTLSPNNQL
ncbi:hypothetical protein OCB09_16945 [Bacillus cereus]|nr:hypothetical protein [Bacillus cereus]